MVLGSESYGFDSLGRVSSKTRTIDTRSYTTQYSQYNTTNQLTQMIYPSGKRVRMNRDTRGRLSGVDKVDSGGTTLLSYLSNVGYNTAGQVTGLSLGNGVAESYGYSNDRLQLTSQTATKSGSTLMSLTYGYSSSSGASGVGTSAGNSGQLMSITGTINSQSRNQTFTYDNVGRMTTATGWSAWQRRFAYDRWGNRTGVWNATSGGTQLQSIALQTSGSVPTNRISNVGGVNYVYDASGNVTNDGAYSYTYDAESRMVSVSVGGSGSYGYDSSNRRIKKVASGTTTHYVWEGGQVIAEYDGTSGALVSEYVHTGKAVIREQGSAIRYYHSDRLSTRMITDGTGAVVGTEDHLPFGEDAGVVGESEKHRFTNYERDSESGSDYAINRQYANSTGRFMRPDPVAGSIGNPQTLNRYSYSLSDPVNLADPLGLRWITVTKCYTISYSYEDEKGNIINSGSETKCETTDVWVSDDLFITLTPIGEKSRQEIINDAVWRARVLLENRAECRNVLRSPFVPADNLVDWFGKISSDGKIHPGQPKKPTADADTTSDNRGNVAEIRIGEGFFGVNGQRDPDTRAYGEGTRFPRLDLPTYQTLIILHELAHGTGTVGEDHDDDGYKAASLNFYIWSRCIR